MAVFLVRRAGIVYQQNKPVAFKLAKDLSASHQSELLKAAAGRLTLEGEHRPLAGPRLFNYINDKLEHCESPGIKAALKLLLAKHYPNITITQQDLSDYKRLSDANESAKKIGYSIPAVREYIGAGNIRHATDNDAIRLINLIDEVKSTAIQKQQELTDETNGYIEVPISF